MTDEEKLSAINETIKNLKDDKKGLSSLLYSIWAALSPEEQQKLKTIQATKPYYAEERFNLFVARKIQEYENNGKKSDGFRQDILDNVRKSIAEIENPQPNNIFIQDTAEYNNIREQLNATPEVFMKYGISTSCSNAAGAFIDEFTKEHPERNQYVKFMFTTVWDHLLDGRSGHIVPCVELNNGDWIIIEPRNPTFPKGEFTKRISKDDFQVGKSFKHLMTFRNGEPYMIKAILDKPFTDHEVFLEKASRVKLDEAQTFINQIFEQGDITEEQYQQQQRKFERQRRIQSLRLATEELGKQVQHGPYVSMDELKKAQAQQAYLGID